MEVEDMDREDLIAGVEEVLRLLKEGYNCGIDPKWGLTETND